MAHTPAAGPGSSGLTGRAGRPRRDVTANAHRACVDLVRRQGYAGTTLDQIAAAAGVAKTTLYRRWDSKAALVLDALVGVLGEPPVQGEDRDAGLRTAVAWLAGRIADDAVHPLLAALVAEASRDADLRAALRAAIREPFEARITAAWSLDPDSIDLAFDVAVGALLHRAALTGAVDDATVQAIAEVAVSLART
ncbi:TetR/AcrR family transcriptional regulator [Nocardioides sp.]|uniref:TetR/AcrR family transcriptional regulator n=1 Tax=Nocardioides sp. TaxID=35761 RepID=UPI00260280AF|nr:TetR/AcrR family transcriptional regulator [Nocardioides sp.]